MEIMIDLIFSKAFPRELAIATRNAAYIAGCLGYLIGNDGYIKCPHCNSHYDKRIAWGKENKALVVIQLIKLYLEGKNNA